MVASPATVNVFTVSVSLFASVANEPGLVRTFRLETVSSTTVNVWFLATGTSLTEMDRTPLVAAVVTPSEST